MSYIDSVLFIYIATCVDRRYPCQGRVAVASILAAGTSAHRIVYQLANADFSLSPADRRAPQDPDSGVKKPRLRNILAPCIRMSIHAHHRALRPLATVLLSI